MDTHNDIDRLFRQLGEASGAYREFGGAELPVQPDTWTPLSLVNPPAELPSPRSTLTSPSRPAAPLAGNTPLTELFGRLSGGAQDAGLHGAT